MADDPTSSPSFWGGLMQGLQNAPENPLFNIGLGLMSAAKPFGNVGDSLMQANQQTLKNQAARQQQGMNALQYRQMAQEMPLRMDWLKALGQQLGAGGTAGATSSPTSSAPVSSGDTSGQSDPMSLMRLGAFGGALGMQGTQGLQELGKTQLQYNAPLATRMESAKSQVAVDQQQIQDALGRGDTNTAQAIAQKMRQDLGLLHIASMSGTQTRIGLGGDISTFNPNEGVQTQNGIESAIPGAAAARGQIEGAISRGKATGETIEVTGPDGAKYTVPKSFVTGGGAITSPAASTGPAAAAPPGAPAELPPAKNAMLVGNAKQALETNQGYQTQAESSKDMLAATQTLMNSANDFTPGRFADSRGKFLDYLNSAGLISPEQSRALGSKQEGDKIAIQLQAAATKQLGSREAAQIFEKMGKSLPNLTLSQDGLAKVSSWMMGMSRYNIARAADANQKAQSQDATGVNTVRDTWIKNSNPLYYVVASASPAAREELLSSMKDRTGFVKQWQAAAKAGYAPRPGDYSGGP